MLLHMTTVDHARVIPGIASSILAVLPDAAGSTKLTQHMSALRQHAYIFHAYIVSAIVSTPRMRNCGLLCSHTLQVDHLCEQVKQDIIGIITLHFSCV